MSHIHIVILAAGKGTRMKSALPKVLHRAGELPIIEQVLRTAEALEPQSIAVILGHQADIVRDSLAKRPGLTFAVQEPQLGTGHALLQAERLLASASGTRQERIRAPAAVRIRLVRLCGAVHDSGAATADRLSRAQVAQQAELPALR